MGLFRFPDVISDNKIEMGERLKVAVLPCSSGAGASYVCSYLLQNGLFNSHTPAGLRTLVELGTPYFYDALGMDKRFQEEDFFEFEKGGKYKTNIELDINWYLRKNRDPLSEQALYKVIAMAPGNLVIYDCSSMAYNEEILNSILCEMDIIYLVIDPLPSKLLASEEFIRNLKSSFPESMYVVNKFNKGIHKAQLSSFLGTNNYFTLPAVDLSHIYSAEYNCILP